MRFEVTETDELKFFDGAAMTVSPNGRWMVFPARGETGPARYWLRALDSVEARALPGTEGAYVPAAWTADSRYVLFTVTGNPALQRAWIFRVGRRRPSREFRGGGLNGAAASAGRDHPVCLELTPVRFFACPPAATLRPR